MRPPASTISFKPETVGSRCLSPSWAKSARRAVNSASSATSSTLTPFTARNIASRVFASRVVSISSGMPILCAAAWDSRTYWAVVGLVSRTRIAILAGFGMSSVTRCNRFVHIAADASHAGDVAARPGKACDESRRHRIEGRYEHDGDLARGVPRWQHRRRSRSQENVHAATDQLGRGGRHLRRVLRQREFDDVVAALDLSY